MTDEALEKAWKMMKGRMEDYERAGVCSECNANSSFDRCRKYPIEPHYNDRPFDAYECPHFRHTE